MSDTPKNSTLPTNQLQPNPFQPRDKISPEDVAGLKISIEKYGILEPLVVAQTPAGYQIIAGERRWRAARELGLEEVPVHIKKTTPRGMLEMAIVENVQRVDLSAIERAQAFQQLVREFGFNPQQISEKVGKSHSYISNTLRLLDLPDAVKDGLVGGQITEGHGRAMLAIKDESALIECYKIVLKKKASVRETEDLVRRFNENLGKTPGTVGRNVNLQASLTDKWAKDLQKAFESKNKVKMIRSIRQTKVTITLKGGIEETQGDLEKILKLAEIE